MLLLHFPELDRGLAILDALDTRRRKFRLLFVLLVVRLLLRGRTAPVVSRVVRNWKLNAVLTDGEVMQGHWKEKENKY